MYLIVGKYEDSLQDAEQALLLAPHQQHSPLLKCKLYHRKAQAESNIPTIGPIQALKTYREGLVQCEDSTATSELYAATLSFMEERIPAHWLASYWMLRITEAEARHPLSSRDGVLLKPVPVQCHKPEKDIQSLIYAAMTEHTWICDEARRLICHAWCRKKAPGKADAAFFRGVAYLGAENAEQAEKDATVALVYGPQEKKASCWSSAYALRAFSFEARGINVPAVLDISRALKYCRNSLQLPAFEEVLERLSRRIPDQYAEALRQGGLSALEALLSAEKEKSRPEFLKPRPKYYYYYEWMRKRIEKRHPALPEPIMDKLLSHDATELDLLLQYPGALDDTVATLMDVMKEDGRDKLETYAVPLLSWDKMQALEKEKGILTLENSNGAAVPHLISQ